ncbi:MAG: universal stress protein [Planctomycetota bacterium]
MPFKKILFPTDFSDTSNHALKYAVSLAREYHAELVLVHVVDNSLDYSFAYSGMTPYQAPLQDYYADIRERTQKLLDDTIEKEVDLTTKTGTEVAFGTPHREIIELAKERGADLIVIGTHGRSGLGHLLIGSTAEKVVREAPCPVLTVRKDQD